MNRTVPPYRADHVGSFLRPAALKDARAKREKGEITAAQLKEVEDREIRNVIAQQEKVGLKLASDGEFRRSWWHFDFFGMLDNVEIYELDHGIQFQGIQTKAQSIRVTGKLGFSSHPMLEHFRFLKANTSVTPKMTIPSPSVLHFRLEPNAVRAPYKHNDDIFDDLGAAYAQAVKGFYDAGCRYLQFDDTAWAYLCSKAEMEKAKARGMNVDRLSQDYARVINQALEGEARRHGDHHPHLPRQFPLHLDRRGRLRAGRRSAARRASTTTAISSSTTPSAPAASSRCASCPRARRSSCSGSSPRSPARSRRRTTSSGASTRRPNSPTSISSP